MAPENKTLQPEIDVVAYEQAVASVTDSNIEAFKQLAQTKLVICLIGDADTGKSSTINALAGKEVAEVSVISGSTKKIDPHDFAEEVLIVDTPGLHDSNTLKLAKDSLEFVEGYADIILFFMNAAAKVDPLQIEAFRTIRKLGKPTLVVLNKIDTIRPDEVPVLLADLKKRLDNFPYVIPTSATKGTNIRLLSNTIVDILRARGKDLFFLKLSAYKEEQVKQWIRDVTIAAACIGALPLPGSDIIPLAALQVALCLKIAYIYNCEVTKGDVMNLISSTVTGMVGKTVFRNVIKALGDVTVVGAPATSMVAAVIAGAMTYGLGWAANAYYKSGKSMNLGEVAQVYENAYKLYSTDKKPELKPAL